MAEQITSLQIKNWLLLFADRINEQQAYLTQLDSVLGDADHGVNMQQATDILRQRLSNNAPDIAERPPNELLRIIGLTLINHIGGAAGPLYGALFLNAAHVTHTHALSTLAHLTMLFENGLRGIQQRGMVDSGEKTMADTLIPAVQSMQNAVATNVPLPEAMGSMRRAAQIGMQQTIELKATKGRASYLSTRSIGHQDPGATSIYLLLETAAEVFGGLDREEMPIHSPAQPNTQSI